MGRRESKRRKKRKKEKGTGKKEKDFLTDDILQPSYNNDEEV